MVFAQRTHHFSVPVAAGDEQHRCEHKEEQEAPQGHGKQPAEPEQPPSHKHRHHQVDHLDARRVSVRDADSQGRMEIISPSISTTLQSLGAC